MQENEDSDQSISEDEDVDYKWSTDIVSLGSASEDKGNIQILSHLETLKGNFQNWLIYFIL
nr:Homeotic protein female sterile like [Ipomoea batatas]GMD23559.1 Homeotic protein female sterile like [Ipomoea batatas]GMD25000.1 Homeotic protein female sterile like [Ipomoea batatas]